MAWLVYLILFLGFIRFCVACANFLSFRYLPQKVNLQQYPRVSVLIPARNEEQNIGRLLAGLKQFRYPDLEILVYDDNSEDNTPETVERFIPGIQGLKLIHGSPLPQGWLGKNHACYRLAQEAAGDYLLFLDADAIVTDGLVERAISYMQKHRLSLLSIFPRQQFLTFAEKISVPLMNWILLSLLPLILVRISKNPAFTAANGQFMFFEAKAYQRLQPHQTFRDNMVEDIAISHYYKKTGLRTDTLLGNRHIRCRMYSNLKDTVNGFTKNIFRFFGGSTGATLLFAAVTTLWPLLFIAGINYGLAYLVLAAGIRIFVSLASKQNVLENILLAVPQHLIFLGIIMKAFINRNKKQLVWKGRNILGS